MNNKPLDVTTYSKLKRMVESLERTMGPRVDMELSFEYIIGSLFPNAWDNIQTALNDAHFQGFLQGREESNNEEHL